MDEDRRITGTLGELEEGEQMVEVAVDRAGRNKAKEMERGAALPDMLEHAEKGAIFVKGTVLDGGDDAREVMVDDAARAHGEVADLRVSGLAPGQPHGDPRGLERGEGVAAFKAVERRLLGRGDGIPPPLKRDAEAVERDEDDGFRDVGHASSVP